MLSGVILFMYKEPKEETSVTSESNSSIGIGEISLVKFEVVSMIVNVSCSLFDSGYFIDM